MTRPQFVAFLTFAFASALGPYATSSALARSSGSDSTAPACVAIVLPTVQGATGDATAFASSLRDLLLSYLTGPTLRAITVDARLPAQAIEEARQKECGNIVLTSIERKRNDGSGWGRALGRAAGTAASYGVPYGGNAATAAARGAAVAGAYAISSMAETTKAKDEVTIEYRVGTPDAVLSEPARAVKGKAKHDGEDMVTPLVEKAAQVIAEVVSKR